MQPEGPLAVDVEAFLKKRKFIKHVPQVIDGKNAYQMRAVVYLQSQPNTPTSYVVMATAHKSPPGVPRPFPSSALEAAGRFRVRGLNYAIRHDCPSGPIVCGWHEHIWSNEYGDQVVIKARPTPKDTSIRGVFNWGLARWKIKVGAPPTKGGRHGAKK